MLSSLRPSLLAHKIGFRTFPSVQSIPHTFRSPGATDSRVEILLSPQPPGKVNPIVSHHCSGAPFSYNTDFAVVFSHQHKRPPAFTGSLHHPRSLRKRAIHPKMRYSEPIPDEFRRKTSHFPSHRTLDPLPEEVPQCNCWETSTAILVPLSTKQLHSVPYMSLPAPSFRHLLASATSPSSRSTQWTFPNIRRHKIYISSFNPGCHTAMDLGFIGFISLA